MYLWLAGLLPISKLLNLQGFVSQKSRSVTAFWCAKVVRCVANSSRPIFDRQVYSLKHCFKLLDALALISWDYGSHLHD
jgi:hypothetical protein